LVRCGRREQTCSTSGGGRVIRAVYYFDRERALADLRLAPEADSQ
jgi:hypothetical protein